MDIASMSTMMELLNTWFITLCIHLIPTRAITKLIRPMFYIPIPRPLRTFVFHLYSSMYGPIKWHEFNTPLTEYRTLNDMFTRKLAIPRTLSDSDIISPADGTIASFGKIEEYTQTLEQIKGVRFELQQLLQSNPQTQVQRRGNQMYYVIIYLSPGDYHRFHSPVDDLHIDSVQHVVGDLHPVKPAWLKQLPGLFAINERIVMSGKWRDDDLYFAYVPVGAFNVGSITLNDVSVDDQKRCGLRKGHALLYGKGDEIGYFNFGSTVVMVFEAPNFRFSIQEQQKVRMGETFGDVIEQ